MTGPAHTTADGFALWLPISVREMMHGCNATLVDFSSCRPCSNDVTKLMYGLHGEPREAKKCDYQDDLLNSFH